MDREQRGVFESSDQPTSNNISVFIMRRPTYTNYYGVSAVQQTPVTYDTLFSPSSSNYKARTSAYNNSSFQAVSSLTGENMLKIPQAAINLRESYGSSHGTRNRLKLCESSQNLHPKEKKADLRQTINYKRQPWLDAQLKQMGQAKREASRSPIPKPKSAFAQQVAVKEADRRNPTPCYLDKNDDSAQLLESKSMKSIVFTEDTAEDEIALLKQLRDKRLKEHSTNYPPTPQRKRQHHTSFTGKLQANSNQNSFKIVVQKPVRQRFSGDYTNKYNLASPITAQKNQYLGYDSSKKIQHQRKNSKECSPDPIFVRKDYGQSYTPKMDKAEPSLFSMHSKLEKNQSQNKQRSKSISCFNPKVKLQDFHIGKNLGQGRFGSVNLVFHKPTGAIFALKKIPKETIKQNFMIDQFILEVKIQNFVQNSYILKIYGLFDDKTNVYLILEYMEQGTLYQGLKQSKKLSQQEVALKMRYICEAVKAVHELGIAHRDIKPENIVLSSNVCKLCDFGWATFCDERRKTYCGTTDYVAPQIVEGLEYDMSVDLWCLGVLAYELLAGKAPFYHISRQQTMRKIMNVDASTVVYPKQFSKEAVSFISGLIRKQPQQRMKADELLRHPFLKNVQN